MSMLLSIPPLDEEGASPLYVQLQRALRDLMVREKLQASDFLPPERDIAKVLGVSRITVRKALDGLEQEGLIERRRGSGTVVTERLQHDFSMLSSFTADVLARGSAPRSHWLDRSSSEATADDTFSLGFLPGTPLFRLNRIRYADEVPMVVEHTVVPAACLAAVDAVEDSLYGALEKVGNRPVRALQRLRAVPFGGEHARMLGVDPGHAGLLIERRAFLRDGRPAEVTRSYYRGDAYDFVAELSDV